MRVGHLHYDFLRFALLRVLSPEPDDEFESLLFPLLSIPWSPRLELVDDPVVALPYSSRVYRLPVLDDELACPGTWICCPRRTASDDRLLQERILPGDVLCLDAIPLMVSPDCTVYELPHESACAFAEVGQTRISTRPMIDALTANRIRNRQSSMLLQGSLGVRLPFISSPVSIWFTQVFAGKGGEIGVVV